MAVYTKISHNDLEQLISGYNIGRLQGFVAIEAGIQNTNYFIDTDIARYVLTIYEKKIDHKDLPFFLKLMGHLAKHGIPCPALIVDKNGNGLTTIKNKPCAITSFLKGGELKTIKTEHIEQLGKNVAKMHLAGNDFTMQRKNDLSIDGWVDMFSLIKNRADELEPGLAIEIESYLDLLQHNWPANLPSGIIHADIFPDNVFFDNDKLFGIIDFYFACNDAFMYELAICINSWCFEKNGEFNTAKAKSLLSSYNNVRKISGNEFTALPILAQGAALRFLLSRLYDWLNRVDGAIVTTKNPMEYLHKLRFHSKVKSYEEYGLQEVVGL